MFHKKVVSVTLKDVATPLLYIKINGDLWKSKSGSTWKYKNNWRWNENVSALIFSELKPILVIDHSLGLDSVNVF
jgi:hypothetical protein